MGCTTGAKILNYDKVVIFKNKDFQVESHSDGLLLEHSHAFGVRGVNLHNLEMGGVSIGVNQYGLAAVNSNILSTTDTPYDLLTERIILESKTIADAIEICENEFQKSMKYQWCNMVIASPEELAAIELTSSDLSVDRSQDHLVRTNHHILLNTNEVIGNSKLNDSRIRYNYTKDLLKAALLNENDIISLLKSHNPEAPICRHGQSTMKNSSFTTVYSYIVTIQVDNLPNVVFDVIKGPPCKQNYTKLEISFPLSAKERKHLQLNYPV
ncbi:MAG: hypothetical protein JSV04_10295 [Candidatus Heimdallarchaeota archaeon]|nr:MAG: hypothetical protein JSV04_10295 [Candidatus Heimdallarchaeota archaeon]